MQFSRKKREALLLVFQGYLQYCGDTLEIEMLTPPLQQHSLPSSILKLEMYLVQNKTKKSGQHLAYCQACVSS